MLGADAQLRLRLLALSDPGDEFVARVERGHIDLVTSHAAASLNVREAMESRIEFASAYTRPPQYTIA